MTEDFFDSCYSGTSLIAKRQLAFVVTFTTDAAKMRWHPYIIFLNNQPTTHMAPYAFVDIPGGAAVVGESLTNDVQLIDLIQHGLRRQAFDHLAHRSELPLPVLADAVNLSTRTLQRYGPEQRLKADASDRLVQLAILYVEGFDLFGEEKFKH